MSASVQPELSIAALKRLQKVARAFTGLERDEGTISAVWVDEMADVPAAADPDAIVSEAVRAHVIELVSKAMAKRADALLSELTCSAPPGEDATLTTDKLRRFVGVDVGVRPASTVACWGYRGHGKLYAMEGTSATVTGSLDRTSSAD